MNGFSHVLQSIQTAMVHWRTPPDESRFAQFCHGRWTILFMSQEGNLPPNLVACLPSRCRDHSECMAGLLQSPVVLPSA